MSGDGRVEMVSLRLERLADADVVVVGGGPAGAAVACHLARAGADVMVLDRQRFPRDKVCGDFVGPAALKEAEDLGLAALPRYAGTNRISRASVFLDGEHLVTAPMPRAAGLPAEGRVIPRLDFDAWLVEAATAAGARLRPDTRVLDHEVGPDGVVLRVMASGRARSLRTRLLVGADGSTSGVARRVRGHKPQPRSTIIAIRAYYSEVDGPDDRADPFFGQHSFPGYCWLFPTGPGTADVGVGMALETVPRSEDRLQALLEELVAGDPALRGRLRGPGVRAGWPGGR